MTSRLRRSGTQHDDPPADSALAGFASIAEALEAPEGRATFVRGLSIGALAGAALVGALFQLRRTRRPPRSMPPD
jgi:hypothetical protein